MNAFLIVIGGGVLSMPAAQGAARPEQGIAAAARPDDDATMRRVAEEAAMWVRAERAEPKGIDARTLVEIAKTQASYGDREAALETLREASRVAAGSKMWVVRGGNTTTSGPSVAHQLGEVGRTQVEMGDEAGARESFERALQIREADVDAPRRVSELREIVITLMNLGDVEETQSVVDRADIEFGGKVERGADFQRLLPEMAAVHVASGDVEGAFGIVARIEVMDLDRSFIDPTIGRAMQYMAEATENLDPDKATPLLQRIRVRLSTLPYVEFTSKAYISVAAALARIGDVEDAKRAARLVDDGPRRSRAVFQDDTPYALFLIALEQVRQGDRDGAQTTLREAADLVEQQAKADGSALRADMIAASYLNLGDLDAAQRCITAIEAGRQHELLSRLAMALRERGDMEAAEQTFGEALADIESRIGREPGRDPKLPNLGASIRFDDPASNAILGKDGARVAARMGRFDVAREIANSIEDDPAQRAFALAEIARIQAAAGQGSAALEWVRELKDLPRTHPSPAEGIIQGIGDYFRKRGEAQK